MSTTNQNQANTTQETPKLEYITISLDSLRQELESVKDELEDLRTLRATATQESEIKRLDHLMLKKSTKIESLSILLNIKEQETTEEEPPLLPDISTDPKDWEDIKKQIEEVKAQFESKINILATQAQHKKLIALKEQVKLIQENYNNQKNFYDFLNAEISHILKEIDILRTQSIDKEKIQAKLVLVETRLQDFKNQLNLIKEK